MIKKASKNEEKNVRPPVVVVLGHVDHGKTQLIDYLRETNVIGKEAGGITQHIGAYQVKYKDNLITFLDTPGHEAFSAIRARGAKVADIAVLIVAADEGVKTQTKEAVSFIKKEKMPFVVAINKIDKKEANVSKVKQELAENEVFVEGWGGQVPVVEISAKTGEGVSNLLEMIQLIADVEELKGNSASLAEGVVIESHLDNKRGNTATLLVKQGTLKLNEWVVSGSAFARIKSMEDFTGRSIKEANLSEPVLTLGWGSLPELGQKFRVVGNKSEAEKLAKETIELESPIFTRESDTEATNKKFFNIVLKADVRSSLEAISQAIKDIKHEEVGYNVVSFGVGNINDNDVKAVISTSGVVFGFYVGAEDSAKRLADKEKIKIKTFEIIYDLVKELRESLSELLEPEVKRTQLGKIKVLALFGGDVKSQVVGGEVISGKVSRGALIDVLRNGGVLASGRLTQLQHEKADVSEVKEGMQCGIKFEGQKVIQEGDILEIYREEKIKRTI